MQARAALVGQALLRGFDRLFLPRVRHEAERTQKPELLLRARCMVAVAVFAGLDLWADFDKDDYETAPISAVIGWTTVVVQFGFLLVLRRVREPTRLGQALGVILIVEMWILLLFGPGISLFASANAPLLPVAIGLCAGATLGVVSAASAIACGLVVYWLDTRSLYRFPVVVPPEEIPDYVLSHSVTASLYAAVLTLLYSIVHVAEMRRVNEDLRVALNDARDAAESRMAFIATMSHEIRTPLNGILGMAQVLSAEGDLNPQQAEEVSMLQTCGENLLHIVNDILDMAKISANKIELESLPFRVHEVIERCLTIVGVRAAQSQVHLAYDSRQIEQCPVYLGDGNRLQQVVLNLLSNAIKFTPALGWVSVRATVTTSSHGADSITIEVSDTGVGIPADRIHAIFDAFVQSDASVTRKHGGTGLGLTISRSLLQLMRGDLRVTSKLGAGSTFSVVVPLTVAHSADKLPAPVAEDINVILLEAAPESIGSTLLQAQLRELATDVVVVSDQEAAATALRNRSGVLVVNTHPYETISEPWLTWLASSDIPPTTRIVVTVNNWAPPSTALLELRRLRPSVRPCSQPATFRALRAALYGQETGPTDDIFANGELSWEWGSLTSTAASLPTAAAAAQLRHHIGDEDKDDSDGEEAAGNDGRNVQRWESSSESGVEREEEETVGRQLLANTPTAVHYPIASRQSNSSAGASGGRGLRAAFTTTGGSGSNLSAANSLTSGKAVSRPGSASASVSISQSAPTPISPATLLPASTRTSMTAPSAATAGAATAPTAATPAAAPAKKSLYVLVVDDNTVNQQVVTRLLKVLGHVTEVANDGPAAIALIQARLTSGASAAGMLVMYDAVLMDLHMPGMTGQEAAARIRVMCGGATPYMIAASADALQTTRDGCRDAGFDAFLPKPFLLPQLKANMAAAAARAATTQQF